jgi:hypothetical protein
MNRVGEGELCSTVPVAGGAGGKVGAPTFPPERKEDKKP